QAFPGRGVLFYGDQGLLYCGGAGVEPQWIGMGDVPKIEPSIPRVQSHMRDWLDSIRSGKPAGSHFEYGARLTEIALLGALSLRTGQAIHWDSANMKAIGNDAADAIIRQPRRDGWQLNVNS
ncbi:MAG TPA: gfo/Idh/MocA family oxidoreductase, partial [Planctomycetaceae bacterium]|nr:gfo/Idh/MocA family oxidoreductase [Planctomycetaceae bacterium]